jgi:ribonuclease P protein component
VQVLAAPAAAGMGRVGFVIGKQQLVRAVDRNYVRRMMRETVRARRPELGRFDLVLRLRARCARSLLPALALEAAGLLDALIASTHR